MDLSQFGASGAVVGVVFIFLQYMAKDSKRRDKQHDETISALNLVSRNSEDLGELVRESHTYIKTRNGSLDKTLNNLTDKIVASEAIMFSADKQLRANNKLLARMEKFDLMVQKREEKRRNDGKVTSTV